MEECSQGRKLDLIRIEFFEMFQEPGVALEKPLYLLLFYFDLLSEIRPYGGAAPFSS